MARAPLESHRTEYPRIRNPLRFESANFKLRSAAHLEALHERFLGAEAAAGGGLRAEDGVPRGEGGAVGEGEDVLAATVVAVLDGAEDQGEGLVVPVVEVPRSVAGDDLVLRRGAAAPSECADMSRWRASALFFGGFESAHYGAVAVGRGPSPAGPGRRSRGSRDGLPSAYPW